MAVEVVGAVEVAAWLAGQGAFANKQAKDAAQDAANRIQRNWMEQLRRGRSGFTASRTQVETRSTPAVVEAEVFNDFMVARFLQYGTAHHSPKVDLYGAAGPEIDRFVQDLADAIDD